MIRDDLARFSIRMHDMARDRREPPPVSSILVHRATGERTVVSANAAVFSPVSAEFNPRWLAGVSIVLLDGQYMPLCIAAAKAAHERGIPVVLDSGSWKPGMAETVAVCSTPRSALATSARPVAAARATSSSISRPRKIPRVAITRGGSAIGFVEDAQRGEISVRRIRPIDTLGAGDIFHGAFCYYAVSLARRSQRFGGGGGDFLPRPWIAGLASRLLATHGHPRHPVVALRRTSGTTVVTAAGKNVVPIQLSIGVQLSGRLTCRKLCTLRAITPSIDRAA